MKTANVTPAEGRRIRDPITLKVIGPGAVVAVQLDGFWRRRIADGDVVITTEAPRLAPKPIPPESTPSPAAETKPAKRHAPALAKE